MKICFLLTQDIASPSGLGRYYPWAKELARLGYEVSIISLHPNFANLREREFLTDGINVKYVGQMHVKKQGSAKTYFSPAMLLWIVCNATINLFIAVREARADIIILGKPHPMNGLAALLVKGITKKVKLIVDCDDDESNSNRFHHRFEKSVVAWFERWVPKNGHIVTANTHYTLNRLRGFGIPQDKLVYLPNGIDHERFENIDPTQVVKLRNLLQLSGRKVISYIGSMSLPSHPIDLLLKAFCLVQVKIPDAILMLVGGGEDLELLKKMSQDLFIDHCTLFVGRVPPDRVPYYYAVSDVSIEPVNDDAAGRGRCPLKMFESWASGVPFITSDVGDRAQLAGNPPAAVLAIAGDKDSLALNLHRLLDDSTAVTNIRYLATQRVSRFYWSNLVNLTEWIFTMGNNN